MIVYHGVHADDVDSVRAEGLLMSKTRWSEAVFQHLSFAETPGMAAGYGTVFEVDLTGLDVPEEGFVEGELQMHEDIAPSRVRLLDQQPIPDARVEPTFDQHPTCVRLRCWERAPSGASAASDARPSMDSFVDDAIDAAVRAAAARRPPRP